MQNVIKHMIMAALRDGWHVMVYNEHDAGWDETLCITSTTKLIRKAMEDAPHYTERVSVYLAPEACCEHEYMQQIEMTIQGDEWIAFAIDGEIAETWWEQYTYNSKTDNAFLLPLSQAQN